jgi:hypothetical protein
MMAKLRWSMSEISQVIAMAAQLRRSEPDLSPRDALYRAQGAVPLEEKRRKKHFTFALEGTLKKLLETAEKNPPYVHPQDPMLLVDPNPAVPEASPPEVVPTESLLSAIGREFGGALGAALMRQVQPVFAAAVQDALATLLAAKAPNGNGNGANHVEELLAQANKGAPPRDFGKLPEKLRAHRIAIIGLLGDQQETLRRTFPYLDFRWIDGGASGATVKHATKNCEVAFLMTKFIRHHAQNAVPRDLRVMVNGGVSDLTRLISTRFPQATALEAHH